MGYFRDFLILAGEAVFIPELATYEAELFVFTCVSILLCLLGKQTMVLGL